VLGKIVRKLALYQGQLRIAAHSIPAGFISAAAGGYDPAIQKDLTKVPETSNAPEGRPQSGNRSPMQRKNTRYLKLSAASCGESSILKRNKQYRFTRLPRGKPQGKRSWADSI